MRNALRINCDSNSCKIKYSFRNEDGNWIDLTSDSPLTRREFTNTTMKESSDKIIHRIEEVYNYRNKGLDIFFIGSNEELKYLKNSVSDGRDIAIIGGSTKIVVVGKVNSGKTKLIEGMADFLGNNLIETGKPKFRIYKDELNNTEWYEIDGIDLGIGSLESAHLTICELLDKGEFSTLLYCVNDSVGRIEDAEGSFLLSLINEYPNLCLIVVLTMSSKKSNDSFVNEIKNISNRIKVIVTLAEERELDITNDETGEYYIQSPFGMDELYKEIYE